MSELKGTTIVAVKKDGKIAMAADGQVTMGNSIVLKHSARKIQKLYKGTVLAGFAGSTADAFSLLERFEQKLEEFRGQLKRASVELAKDWRTNKIFQKLEALLIVADKDNLFIISGSGDVIEPDDGIAAIGSGGPYALASARALLRNTNLSCEKIVKESIMIASEICVYTNSNIIYEEL
ncbi:MAG: ATP-dependent protease subunit HslV [Proteobacteria bacterium]|nr:ATP-dependent protease subunit HslV [Pseudomonadota bacterium]